MVLNGYRFRLYPTKEQQQILLRWIGCQRLIYNAKVTENRYFRAFKRRFASLAGDPVPIDQAYSQFKTERTPFLNEVPSQVLRNGAVRWKQAYVRHQRGLAGRPKFKMRRGRQSVWLTSELFSFSPRVDEATGDIKGYRLHVGTKKFPVGEIAYKAHREHNMPASIHIAVEGGQWFLSFSAEDAKVTEHDAETVAKSLRRLPTEELKSKACGLDRGVNRPVMTSDGTVYDLLPIQRKRIAKARRQRIKWQRRAARRKKGSRNQAKAYAKVARYHRYESNVRRDYAHQTSRALADDDRYRLYVLEDLSIQNMTRRPKPKKDAKGRFLPNRRRAKAGLNNAILASAWGQVARYIKYKSLRCGKLAIDVPPVHTSQECAECGHIHPGNRPSQAVFACLRCGHTDNADRNAAINIKRGGIAKLLSGEPLTKKPKPTRFFRNLGPGRSEGPRDAGTPGEIRVRHGKPAHRSLSQETHTKTV